MIRTSTSLSPLQRDRLQVAFLADPPPELRERILQHNRLPAAVRWAPALATVLALALILVLPTSYPDRDSSVVASAVDWRARSVELEGIWRQIGDRHWLLGDVRAEPISRRLRLLDERLSVLVQRESGNSEQLDQLWRERSETLAELVALRQQGGYAVRL